MVHFKGMEYQRISPLWGNKCILHSTHEIFYLDNLTRIQIYKIILTDYERDDDRCDDEPYDEDNY